MTLLELIVSLSIAGAAVAGAYGTVAAVSDYQDRISQATTMELENARIRRTIVAWLEDARLPPEEVTAPFRGLDGSRRYAFRDEAGIKAQELPDDELALLSASTDMLPTDGMVLIRLFIDHDNQTPERGLTAEVTPWPAGAPRRLEIAPHVAGMDIRYFTRVMRQAEWMPSWISSTILPAAIEVSLQPAPPDTLPSLLALPILVSLDGGR
jgi:type II secretory pathway pseudopilin PulG